MMEESDGSYDSDDASVDDDDLFSGKQFVPPASSIPVKSFSEKVEEEKLLLLEAIEEVHKNTSELELEFSKISKICGASRVFYQDILPMVLDGRRFIIDGEGLLLFALSSESLSEDSGGQTLHAVYIVEKFLCALVNQGLNFVITFSKVWSSHWEQLSPSLALIRNSVCLHLLYNTDFEVLGDVSAPWEQEFQDVVEQLRPSFFMTFTGNPNLPVLKREESCLLSKKLQLLRFMIESQIASCSFINLDVVDINSVSPRISSLYAHVYLPSAQLFKLTVNVSTIICSILKRVSETQEQSHSPHFVFFRCSIPDVRILVTMKAAAALLGKKTDEDSLKSIFVVVHIAVLHTVLLSHLPLKMRCFKKLPELQNDVCNIVQQFQHEMILAINEIWGIKTLQEQTPFDFRNCADLWHGHLFKTLFYNVLHLGGLKRNMLDIEVAAHYEELCGMVSLKNCYFSTKGIFTECRNTLQIVKASEGSKTKLLLSHIDKLMPSSCALTKLFCSDIITAQPDLSLQPDPVVQDFLDVISKNKKRFQEIKHWHGNKPMTDEIDRIPETKHAPCDNPRFSQSGRNAYARFNTYYGFSLEGNNRKTVISKGNNPPANFKAKQCEVKNMMTALANSSTTENSKEKQNKRGKNLKPPSKKQQIIDENLKKKTSEELERAEQRLKAFKSAYERHISKGQFLEASQTCDAALLSTIKHDSLTLKMLLRKASALFKHWCLNECDNFNIKNKKRNLQRAKELFGTVKEILNLSQNQNLLLSNQDSKLVSQILFTLGFDDLGRLWNLEYHDITEKKFSLNMDHFQFQLQHMSTDLDRDSGEEADARVVGFNPDPWQRELFDIIDSNQSAVVVAPTSSGKTYASYYCMEQVIRSSDDGIVVYVCPTKPLVNQVYATIYARFKKSMPPGKALQGVFTRDYRENVTSCQILVTVPECLELLLLSPRMHTWGKQLKYVIFDEVHCLVGQSGGLSWENALLLIRCPFLALSATINQPESFVSWLQNVENFKRDQGFKNRSPQTYKVHLVQHSERHNHLRKFILHMDGSMEHMHPYGLLDEALLKECGGIPKHISLSPDETFQLFNAMKERLPSHQKDALSPSNYFKSLSKKGFLTMPAVRLYSEELRKALGTLPTATVMDILGSFRLSNFEAECTIEAIFHNIFVLLQSLRKRKMLPAIVFSYNRELVNALSLEILHCFEDQDDDSCVEEDSPKEEEEDIKKSQKKERRRVKFSNKYHKDLKIFRRPSILDSSTSIRGSGQVDEKLVEFIQKRLMKVGYTSNHVFPRMLGRGVGKHHAGMNSRERSAVEILFRMKVLNLVFATGTLALGIHMPCKTVVIAGDSPYINSLEYHQMSGRAGRRGFDTEGNVVFFGLNQRKLKTLTTANVPVMVGNFPINLGLVLRILLLVSDVTDEGAVSKEATKAAISSCHVLLEKSLLYESSPNLKQKIKHYFLFAHQFLICQGLLDDNGHPLYASGLITHLHYHEPGNFALVYLLNQNVLEKLCKKDSKGNISYDSLIKIMVVLNFLFAPLPFREHLKGRKWNNSQVILPKLPDIVCKALKDYNKEALHIFSHYYYCVSDHIQNTQGDDTSLPVSKLQFPSKETPDMSSPLMSSLNKLCIANNVCSAFAGLSGKTDFDLFPSEGTINNVRHDVDSVVKIVPTILLGVQYNSYALDFFKHGIVEAISKENGLKAGEDFRLLKDFLLTLCTICTSLDELYPDTSVLVKAMNQIKDIFHHNFNQNFASFGHL